MVQIARTALPPNQVFHIALARIFGIGRATGLEVAEACGISKELRVRGQQSGCAEWCGTHEQRDHHAPQGGRPG